MDAINEVVVAPTSGKPDLAASGYAHADYAAALEEFGAPQYLAQSGGWFLKRAISASPCFDGTGCYPMFSCQNWSGLAADLDSVSKDLVSFAAVIDPFGDHDEAFLKSCFKNVVIPFKQHFVTDLRKPMSEFVHAHHQRYARKALKTITVEKCAEPLRWLEDWVGLYDVLIQRHSIKGIAAFSKASFARQLQVPGMVAFRASHEGNTVGMLLWCVQGEVAFYHLGSYSEAGYQMRASFALFWTALEYFAANHLRYLNLGAGAGVSGGGEDGLSQFKRGWTTEERTAYFCGRIFSVERYEELVKARAMPPTNYFPAYRKGEFA